MSDLRKAAEMALEALLKANQKIVPGGVNSDTRAFMQESIKALRQALAQPEQEPFIYVREVNEKLFGGYEHCSEADAGAFPVYTAPPRRKWVGLTDEEIEECKINGGLPHAINWRISVKVMEAKLKEKNT